MEVICINDSWTKDPKENYPHGFPKFGNKYTVIAEDVHPRTNILGYELEGIPYVFWRSDYFVIASNIDEKEFQRNYNKELV